MTVSHKAREILKLWPKWVSTLRARGFKVASDATRQRLCIGTGSTWDPDAAYMYRKRRGGHDIAVYYKFTSTEAPRRFDQDTWR